MVAGSRPAVGQNRRAAIASMQLPIADAATIAGAASHNCRSLHMDGIDHSILRITLTHTKVTAAFFHLRVHVRPLSYPRFARYNSLSLLAVCITALSASASDHQASITPPPTRKHVRAQSQGSDVDPAPAHPERDDVACVHGGGVGS